MGQGLGQVPLLYLCVTIWETGPGKRLAPAGYTDTLDGAGERYAARLVDSGQWPVKHIGGNPHLQFLIGMKKIPS